MHIPTSSPHNAPFHYIIGDTPAITDILTNIINLTKNKPISIPKIVMSNSQFNSSDSPDQLIPPYPPPSATDPQTAPPHINSTEMDTTNHKVFLSPIENNNNPSNTIRNQKHDHSTAEEGSEELEQIHHFNKYRNQDAHDNIHNIIHIYHTLFNTALGCNAYQPTIKDIIDAIGDFLDENELQEATYYFRQRVGQCSTSPQSYAADLARARHPRPPDPEDPESVGAVLNVR